VSSVIVISDLSENTIRQMAALYLQNFEGTSEAIFRADLAEKDEAILLCHDQQLVGFTTLKLYERTWLDRPILIVYSGDTIVSPQHWGQQELASAWISRIGMIKRNSPDLRLFWFLLVKGHRTFKYLSVFGKSFFPHWREKRDDLKQLANQLATEKFSDSYEPEAGVVKFPDSRGHLKTAIASPSPAELQKEATQFFLDKNPGFRMGHELVCICELELFNMKPLTARIFRRAMGRDDE
jgi:hypothetical protein